MSLVTRGRRNDSGFASCAAIWSYPPVTWISALPPRLDTKANRARTLVRRLLSVLISEAGAANNHRTPIHLMSPRNDESEDWATIA